MATELAAVLAGISAAGLFVYLFYALVKAERF
ncbi:K(+)-transporting ATPase subunit F [Sphingomonas sp. 10B4]|nr:K(+)-transporting ATPase subunit F [Sphingomonas sp. 10B4]MDY7524301.1 K(+)-transporting ATPase subunit F [Sphingomonas sp. 10B4]MEB0282233.1 K(+)-transporting ATPase subunit F [Sphingomonas sp. 10B4]